MDNLLTQESLSNSTKQLKSKFLNKHGIKLIEEIEEDNTIFVYTIEDPLKIDNLLPKFYNNYPIVIKKVLEKLL